MSLDCLGVTEIGLDLTDTVSTVLQTAGGLTTGITSMVEKEQARKKAEAEEQQAIAAATDADRAAAVAISRAAMSAQLKSPGAAMDKMAAENAIAMADRAGAKLSAVGNDLRAQAAQQARANAIAAAQAAPRDASKAAMVTAWTQIINKASAGAIAASDKPAPIEEPKSWLSQKTGPVPNWGLTAGALGLVALVAKKLLG